MASLQEFEDDILSQALLSFSAGLALLYIRAQLTIGWTKVDRFPDIVANGKERSANPALLERSQVFPLLPFLAAYRTTQGHC